MPLDRTREEVAEIIERFLDGSCGEWDWDDSLSIKVENVQLDAVRQRCAAVCDDFPADQVGHYCSAAGVDEALAYIATDSIEGARGLLKKALDVADLKAPGCMDTVKAVK